MTPRPDAVERFRFEVVRLLGHPPADPIALAVSGGPDSMAMLVLGHAAFPGQIRAATVDHRLRPASATEAAMVGDVCGPLGIPHAILAIGEGRPARGNLHDWARGWRYRLLLDWAVAAGAGTLCTAHHADDQAETFLMRAGRAAGLSGLAGIRARIDGGDGEPGDDGRTAPVTLRPLLRWRRAELRELVETLAIPFVDDPANDDPRFDRARLRRWLAQAPSLDAVRVARSAEHLAEAEADLAAVAQMLWFERWRGPRLGEVLIDVSGLPRGIRRLLVRRAIAEVRAVHGLTGTRGSDSIETLLDRLEAGETATRQDVLCAGQDKCWCFRLAPPRRSG